MANITDAEIDAALLRGKEVAEKEPRGASVRFVRDERKIVVILRNGEELSVPVWGIQGLSGATDEQISDVELVGDGYGLRWDALDVDMSVPGLAAGRLGTREWMAKIERLSTTEKAVHANLGNRSIGQCCRKW